MSLACGYCDKEFVRRWDLDVQVRTHTGECPFACTYEGCKRKFATSGNWHRHLRLHSGDRPFSCLVDGCNKAFVDAGSLKKHSRTHSGEKPFACAECSRAFSTSGGLRQHSLVTHALIHPFTCEECGEAFATRDTLTTHQRVHSGEKPFVCAECTRSFSQRTNLVRHERIHSQERPYVCGFQHCGQAFTDPSNLQKHKKTHTIEGQLRKKVEEQKIATCLEQAHINFSREHFVSFGCWDGTFARTDFVILVRGGVVFLEVDEHQHDGYGVECEVARMVNIHSSLAAGGNRMPILFIRYNPHAFKVNGSTKPVSTIKRQRALVDLIKGCVLEEEGKMEILYMYYDALSSEGETKAAIWSDPSYDAKILPCCRNPIWF